jgi:hypothetical protein
MVRARECGRRECLFLFSYSPILLFSYASALRRLDGDARRRASTRAVDDHVFPGKGKLGDAHVGQTGFLHEMVDQVRVRGDAGAVGEPAFAELFRVHATRNDGEGKIALEGEIDRRVRGLVGMHGDDDGDSTEDVVERGDDGVLVQLDFTVGVVAGVAGVVVAGVAGVVAGVVLIASTTRTVAPASSYRASLLSSATSPDTHHLLARAATFDARTLASHAASSRAYTSRDQYTRKCFGSRTRIVAASRSRSRR